MRVQKNKKKKTKQSAPIKNTPQFNQKPQTIHGSSLKPMQDLNVDRSTQDISLCLVMIVKDEGDTIRKCLTKVSPYISYYVICDTGSKDNTIEEIKSTMDELGIEGEIHERPWVNFEVNRTESLELAKDKCDYRWIIDADDTFEVADPNINPFHGLSKEIDCFQLLYRLNNLQYHRAQLVRSSDDWVYKGVLHEYLDLPGRDNVKQYQIPGNLCHVSADISPLKRANSLEEKYAKDAEILEEALQKEPENTRYMFYLAQSYRDSGQRLKSIDAYEKRAAAGGWEEEVYYSLYMVARLKEQLGRHPDEVITAYSKAWEYRPQRLEAVFHAMRKLREQNRWVLAFTYGNSAIKNPGTSDILFVEPEIWQWRLLDEYALAAFHTGNPEIAFEKTEAIMREKFFHALHPQEKERIKRNASHFREAASKKAEMINKQKEAKKQK
jgi:glycosyltransferase involved in cell wall biosynthesis